MLRGAPKLITHMEAVHKNTYPRDKQILSLPATNVFNYYILQSCNFYRGAQLHLSLGRVNATCRRQAFEGGLDCKEAWHQMSFGVQLSVFRVLISSVLSW